MKKTKWDIIGFRHAFYGLKSAFLSERNMKIHLGAAIIVGICAFFFSTSLLENAMLILTIGIVFFAELINTAIEYMINLVCRDILKENLGMPEYNEKAKLAKDISAGAVLVTAIMAVFVGIVIFLPKLIDRFFVS